MQHFGYGRDRSHAIGQMIGWTVLFAFEGMVLATLFVVFAPWLWLKIALPLAFVVLLAASHIRGRRVLQSSHELTDDALTLVWGAKRFAIPRASIRSARRIDERTLSPFTAGPMKLADGRLQLTMSHEGQIQLDLDPPFPLSLRRCGGRFSHVVINVDEPDELLRNIAHIDASSGAEDDSAVEPITSKRHRFPAGEPGIEAIHLTREWNGKPAVRDLSLMVYPGEIYGFIGPNGAGKTTTISMLVGLLAPSSGAVRICGHDHFTQPVLAKSSYGYVPDRPALFDTLTGREHLEFVAQLHRIPRATAEIRIEHLIDAVDLGRDINDAAGGYSLGTKRKLSLAMALVHDPRVLILDEPFNGLDPQTSRRLRALIVDRANNGNAILMSTHDLALVEHMCNRVGLIRSGCLITEGAPAAVRDDAPSLEDAFLTLTGVSS